MRTTVDLPDDLLRQATALEGVTSKEQELRHWGRLAAPGGRRHRSKLPIIQPRTGRPLPTLTSSDLHALLDEDDGTGGGDH